MFWAAINMTVTETSFPRNQGRDLRVAALAYFRTREGGPSLEEQEKQVAGAAEANGLVISSRLVEVAHIGTGDIVDRRLELFELLAEAQSRRSSTVLIAGAGAIAENPVEAAIVAIMLQRTGCSVVFADGFDLEPYRNQAGRIIAGEFGSASEIRI